MERTQGYRRGHCLVGWQRVCRASELGGLDVHNLEVMGWSLHMRWLWLKKTQPARFWAGLDFQVHPKASAMFGASIKSVVGDGASTLFWTDKWIQGKSIVDLAPDMAVVVLGRLLKC
jgi:hypothetical protein